MNHYHHQQPIEWYTVPVLICLDNTMIKKTNLWNFVQDFLHLVITSYFMKPNIPLSALFLDSFCICAYPDQSHQSRPYIHTHTCVCVCVCTHVRMYVLCMYVCGDCQCDTKIAFVSKKKYSCETKPCPNGNASVYGVRVRAFVYLVPFCNGVIVH
jgi:hypothetical protein